MSSEAYNAEFSSLLISLDKGTGADIRTRYLEFDDSHCYDVVSSLLMRLDAAGWRVTGVRIFTTFSSEFVKILDVETVAEVFGALLEDSDEAGTIIAYGELFGWTAEPFTRNRYGRAYKEGFHGVYETLGDFARQHVCEDQDEHIPDYVVVDWEKTYNEISDGFSDFEYDNRFYVFFG